MYLRMLKKDLKEKIGLNIILFFLMIMSATFMALGFVMLYSTIQGVNKTYELCKTSDMVIMFHQNLEEPTHNETKLRAYFNDMTDQLEMVGRQVVRMNSDCVKLENVNNEDSMHLQYTEYLLSAMPTEMNVPYNMEDKPFAVENGQIAIGQTVQRQTGARIGDTLRITTQFGNIYEFVISDIYKNPASATGNFNLLIVSDSDLEVLLSECPLQTDLFELNLGFTYSNTSDYLDQIMELGPDLTTAFEEEGIWVNGSKILFYSDEGMISVIVSAVMEVIAVFLVIMIFVTINFSLKSAIKREEKEIGVMKAMGVYSLSYRSLFAVKYIAFALLGSLIGLPMALISSKQLINTFLYNTVMPTQEMGLFLSVLAAVITVGFIVGFTFWSLRHMNCISVMDAIHGENRGERFKKVSGVFLYKKKHMSIPLFLAMSDIMKRVKRYIYLIMAYLIGVSMILLVVQVKDTLCSVEYMQKYWQKGKMDFAMVIENLYFDQLIEKAGSVADACQLINDNFEKNGIPAKVEYEELQQATLSYQGKDTVCNMSFGDYDVSQLIYAEGGYAPQLANEIALPHYYAKQNGIQIGDVVTLEYSRYNEDRISFQKVEEEYVVTGFFDGICVATPYVYMGEQFTGAVCHFTDYFSRQMNCSNAEYDEMFQKMDDLYTDDQIRFIHKDGVIDYYMGSWVKMFNLMILVASVVVALVLCLLTVLYENIFIEEEVADVALLKSMGFTKTSVKAWHYLRILLLLVGSILCALVFMKTIGAYAVIKIVTSIMHIVEFKLVMKMLSNLVIIPVAVIVLVSLVMVPTLKPMDLVQIWRVKNE